MRSLPLPTARAVRPRGVRAPRRMGIGSGIRGEHVEGSSAPGKDRCVAVEAASASREPVLDPRTIAADARLHVEAEPDAPRGGAILARNRIVLSGAEGNRREAGGLDAGEVLLGPRLGKVDALPAGQ